MAEKVTKLTRKRELEREARQTESGVQKKARLEVRSQASNHSNSHYFNLNKWVE